MNLQNAMRKRLIKYWLLIALGFIMMSPATKLTADILLSDKIVYSASYALISLCLCVAGWFIIKDQLYNISFAYTKKRKFKYKKNLYLSVDLYQQDSDITICARIVKEPYCLWCGHQVYSLSDGHWCVKCACFVHEEV